VNGAQQMMKQLIDQDKVSIVIGEIMTEPTLAMAILAEKAKVPMITPAASYDEITDNKNYVFSATFTDSFQGYAMAYYVYQRLNARSVVIFEDRDTLYTQGVAHAFDDYFILLGGRVVQTFRFDESQSDFTAELQQILQLKPDAIVLSAYPVQAADILAQASQLNVQGPFVGGDALANIALAPATSAAEHGVYAMSPFFDDGQNPVAKEFTRLYREKYGTPPDMYAALAYDTVYIVREAVRRANSTNPQKIAEALGQISDWQGVRGKISMNPHKQVDAPAIVVKFTSTGFQEIERIYPQDVTRQNE
jgi:branched-chain amino acid transport system substrate-binding protein